MNVEIRPATPDEMAEFAHVSATGLGIPGGMVSPEHPEQTLCVFENGKMVTTYRSLPFTLYFNGKTTPVAGIADVGTLPMHRRKGYLGKTVAHHFLKMHEAGDQSIAVLWPSRVAIYRRYGYELVTMQQNYRIEQRYLQFDRQAPAAGSFTEITEPDAGVIAELYHRFAVDRTGYLLRPQDRWRKITLNPQEAGPLAGKVLYKEGDTPKGYLIYDMEPVRGGLFHHDHRVTVKEVVYLDMVAFHAVWRYIAALDLVDTVFLPSVSQDDPLLYLLKDPLPLATMESESSTAALMARLVDVDRALSQRGYAEEGRLIFEITDELCTWNHGRWELEVSGGTATVKRSRKSPQVSIPVGTLASLAFGYLKASTAQRIGLLDVLEPGATAVWDRVMQTAYRPFCPDHF
ncbi:MAG: GNAT family N-acetyltransferase [Spirochaetales bacterium]|nr:GNAT family N-acetyltransferase [Spirochaetales bacterium]